MCFDICTINIRMSIQVRGLHLVFSCASHPEGPGFEDGHFTSTRLYPFIILQKLDYWSVKLNSWLLKNCARLLTVAEQGKIIAFLTLVALVLKWSWHEAIALGEACFVSCRWLPFQLCLPHPKGLATSSQAALKTLKTMGMLPDYVGKRITLRGREREQEGEWTCWHLSTRYPSVSLFFLKSNCFRFPGNMPLLQDVIELMTLRDRSHRPRMSLVKMRLLVQVRMIWW